MADLGYVIVQHSGFGYNADPQFEKGLETRRIPDKKTLTAIEKAGGVVMEYLAAEEFCEKAMYPSNAGMIPNARGTFADLTVDGLRVYVPVRQIVG